MLSVELYFAIFLTITLLVGLSAGLLFGRGVAMGAAMSVALCVPTWFQITLFDLRFTVPAVAGGLFLLAMCVYDHKSLLTRWGLLDLWLGAFVIWGVVGEWYVGASPWTAALRFYGEWILPYAAGRYAVTRAGTLAKLAPWFVGAAVVLAALAVIESLTSINLFAAALHEIDDSVRRPTDKRYGLLYRAVVQTRNPIFFGIVLLTMVPWVFALMASRLDGTYRKTSLGAGLLSVVMGVLASVSRGPIFGLIGFAGLLASFRNRRVMAGLAVVGLAIGGWVAANPGGTVDFLDQGISQQSGIMEIDGEAQLYDGTRHRIQLFQVYLPIIADGGPFGYGTEATTGFPPSVPGLPTDFRTRERLGIVDNSFLLMGLRTGYVGLFLFAGLFFVAAFVALTMKRTASTFLHPCEDYVMDAFAATILAVGSCVLSVYWNYDHAYWILFLIGIIGGLATHRSGADCLRFERLSLRRGLTRWRMTSSRV